jgi:hypothetical protein
MQLKTTLVRAVVAGIGVPRGSLGIVADEPRRGVYLVRWLDPIPGKDAHEAPGGACEIPENALEGVGMLVIDAPPRPDMDAASRLWVPGR